MIHADERLVVTAARDGGRLKGSDAEVWNDFFHVWTFRDGKVTKRLITELRESSGPWMGRGYV